VFQMNVIMCKAQTRKGNRRHLGLPHLRRDPKITRGNLLAGDCFLNSEALS
jgi:hypothetical protein